MATAEAPALAVGEPATLEYVEVYDEPLHPTVFENDHVRVLKVDCPRNQDTMLHRHSQDSFFLFFRTAQVLLHNASARRLSRSFVYSRSVARGTTAVLSEV